MLRNRARTQAAKVMCECAVFLLWNFMVVVVMDEDEDYSAAVVGGGGRCA